MKFIKLTQVHRKYDYVRSGDGLTSKRTVTENVLPVFVNVSRVAYLERKKAGPNGEQAYTDVVFHAAGEDGDLSLSVVETPEEIMARFT